MRPTLVAMMLGAALAAASCSNSGGQPATPLAPGGGASTQVGIDGDAYQPGGTAVFAPDAITVDRGTIVTWTNNDQTTHTTNANSGVWSGSIAAGGSYSRQFTTSGTFEYHCTIHPYMTGTVVVR